jgi:hypothetical protein
MLLGLERMTNRTHYQLLPNLSTLLGATPPFCLLIQIALAEHKQLVFEHGYSDVFVLYVTVHAICIGLGQLLMPFYSLSQ